MNDPYKIEKELVSLLKDRNRWRTGQGFKNLNPKQFQDQMKETYKYLHDTSETLFKGSFDGMFDTPAGRDRIKHMLKLMKDIYDGKKNQEDVQRSTDNSILEIDSLAKQKESEILKV